MCLLCLCFGTKYFILYINSNFEQSATVFAKVAQFVHYIYHYCLCDLHIITYIEHPSNKGVINFKYICFWSHSMLNVVNIIFVYFYNNSNYCTDSYYSKTPECTDIILFILWQIRFHGTPSATITCHILWSLYHMYILLYFLKMSDVQAVPKGCYCRENIYLTGPEFRQIFQWVICQYSRLIHFMKIITFINFIFSLYFTTFVITIMLRQDNSKLGIYIFIATFAMVLYIDQLVILSFRMSHLCKKIMIFLINYYVCFILLYNVKSLTTFAHLKGD